MLEKNYTLTIGIPAHNEAQNIQFLLESLLQQTSSFYILEKIIVICDGCTDETEAIVKYFSSNQPVVTVINDQQHIGKSERLNQLYRMNTSDILITIDADLIIGNNYVLDEMVRHFDTDEVAVVSGNSHPMPGENNIERMINTWYEFWYEVRHAYNQGDNIHNLHGAILALRKSFADTIIYPVGTIANSQYLYFAIKAKQSGFYFAKEAVVYFYSPNTLRDYLLILNRYSAERRKNAEIFGEWIYKEYTIPKIYKIKALLKTFASHPVLITFAFLFHIWRKKIFTTRSSVKSTGLWQIVKSTKRTVKKKYPISMYPNL